MQALRPYFVGFLAVAIATVAGLFVGHLTNGPAPVVSVLFGIIVAAWYGGQGPGLAATALGMVMGFALLGAPNPWEHVFSLTFRLGLTGLVGVAISVMGGSLHRTRRALARDNAQLNVLLDHLPAAVLAVDAEGRVRRSNARVEEIMRHPPHGALDAPWGARDADGTPLPREKYATTRALRGDRVAGQRIRYVRGDGSETWLEVHAAPIREAGEVTGAVSIFTDVGPQMRTLQELEESRTSLVIASQAAGSGSFDADLVAGTNRWSPELEALYGWAPGEYSGTHGDWAARVHPDDLARAEADIAESMVKGAFLSEWRVVLPGGEVRWLQAQGRVWFDDQGKPVRMAGVNIDVSARRQLEESLREKTASLEAESRNKDQFLAILGHELRNPLAPLRTAVELLRMRPGDVGVAEKSAAVMARQIGQLTSLVDELLEVSRISSGKIHLAREWVGLDEIVRDAIETSMPLLESRGHVLAPYAASRLRVEVDRARMVQVFVNMLNNAAKYTDPGGRIAVETAFDGREAQVTVRDNGIGIPPEALPRVFELFSQVDAAAPRTQGGLGLGLNVVRRLVELHGGTVHAASEGPGRGSAFSVRLAAAREDAAAAD